MRKTALMVGDWVSYKGKMPCRILLIGHFGVEFDNATGQPWCSNFEDLDPIPLTEEILAKNFEKREGLNAYGHYSDFVEVRISEYTDSLWEVIVDEVEYSVLPTWKMYVSHVHELQHALRLAGVFKIIDLCQDKS